MPLPNRLAVYVTAAGALVAGLAPLIGNFDFESTAGIVAAIIAITGVVSVWLYNWGKWERGEGAALWPGEPEDVFDEGAAEAIPDEVVAAAGAPEGTTLQRPGGRVS